ncbi:MAG TPA: polyprenyl synthetase family protein [Solirubrobacteraceae bacterium]|nr:polyprenyl synthetase family protein [Solirubrobacteraceae bacterium]
MNTEAAAAGNGAVPTAPPERDPTPRSALTETAAAPGGDPVARLGAEREISLLRRRIGAWLNEVDEELRPPLRSAFAGKPKSFRPLTVFGTHRAVTGEAPTSATIARAFAVELVHNMSLIVDDVLDESDLRRGVATIHSGYGRLPALMASGYLIADAYEVLAGDEFGAHHIGELLRRLAAAECLQWRLRRQPLGTEDWRHIAGEDTGSMFEVCAVLGAGSERLRTYGHLLGVLYHGCDDVGDQRGLEALGGGGDEDIRDGILTLPAALAIRDPKIRRLFLRDDRDVERLDTLARACVAQVPEAERVLDEIAEEACAEARRQAEDPQPLLALVDEVRQLSSR